MGLTTSAVLEALAPLGVVVAEPHGLPPWRGRDRDGPVLVTALRPRSRAHLAGVRGRVDRLMVVQHRGLVPLLGCAVTGEHALVVQRELAGPDLAALVRVRGAWSAAEVRGVVGDLAAALAALHAAGLVHGDVAPANVVLDGEGRAVLVDLVQGAGPDELGTPGWAAPERSSGATPAADVYSLGAVGAALLGRCPEADTDLRSLVDRCSAAEPQARPAAADLADALERTGPSRPVTGTDDARMVGALLQEQVARDADDDRTVRRPRPARGRHRRRGLARGLLVPTVLAALLLVGALTGLGLTHLPSTRPAVAGAPPVVRLPVVDADDAAAERAARGLTHRRASALARGDLLALLSLTEPGSPAAGADRALWRPDASGRGDVTVRYARVVVADAGEWRVAVGVEVDGTSQDVVLRLVRADGRWLVRAVEQP